MGILAHGAKLQTGTIDSFCPISEITIKKTFPTRQPISLGLVTTVLALLGASGECASK
jgi:hypothetical protein